MMDWLNRKYIFFLKRDKEASEFEVIYNYHTNLADRPAAQQEEEIKELLENGIIAKLNAYFRKLDAEGDTVHGYGVLPKNMDEYAVCFSDETFSDLLIAYYQDY